MRRAALGARLAEQAAEEIDVLVDAEIRVEIFPEALRHIGDPGTHGRTVTAIRDVAAQYVHSALLQPLGTGDEAQEG